MKKFTRIFLLSKSKLPLPPATCRLLQPPATCRLLQPPAAASCFLPPPPTAASCHLPQLPPAAASRRLFPATRRLFPAACCLFLFTFLLSSSLINAQVVNQVTIIPSNPGPTDTISVISDFSYYGNCTYGLVYSYSYLVDTVIHILPTYCGYLDTTLCNTIDTFQVGPFPAGNYSVIIEYHQGSVCPVSGFDATIALLDTNLFIGGVTATSSIEQPLSLTIYPSPFNDYISIRATGISNAAMLYVNSIDGRNSYTAVLSQKEQTIDLLFLRKGLYFIEVKDNVKRFRTKIVKL
jgi:hypothetical protein